VAAGTVGAMPVFALSTVHGPGWDDTRPIRKQHAWDKHAAFMDGLVEDGFIILDQPDRRRRPDPARRRGGR